MVFEPSSLELRIYAILRSPVVDFEAISAKRIRLQLAEERPELADDLRLHKKAVDEIVLTAYHTVKSERDPPATPEAASSAQEDSDLDDVKPAASSQPVPLKKAKKPITKSVKKELTDAELAKQLHDSLNSGSRTTRNGRTTSAKKGKTTGGSSRKKKLSEDVVIDSEDENETASGSDVKLKKSKKRKAAKSEDEEENDSGDFKPAKKKRGGGGGFNKPWALSPEMSAVCNDEASLSRPQVVKHIWTYIRSNELQNPKDKRQIICDEKLQAVMGTKKVTAFSMNKHVGKHLFPMEDAADEVIDSEDDQVKEED